MFADEPSRLAFFLHPPAGEVPRMAFLSEEPGQVAHAGGKQAPGRGKAGQGGADVPTQTPPQVGGAAGRWWGSWAIRRRECLEGMSVDLLHAAGRVLGGFQIPSPSHLQCVL